MSVDSVAAIADLCLGLHSKNVENISINLRALPLTASPASFHPVKRASRFYIGFDGVGS